MDEPGHILFFSAIRVILAGFVAFGLFRLITVKGQAFKPIHYSRKWMAWIVSISSITILPKFFRRLDSDSFAEWIAVTILMGILAFIVGFIYGKIVGRRNESLQKTREDKTGADSIPSVNMSHVSENDLPSIATQEQDKVDLKPVDLNMGSTASLRQGEAEDVGKASIRQWRYTHYYAIGVLCLAVVIGLLVLGYSSNIGIFGPIKYDVYECAEDPPKDPPPGPMNLWDKAFGPCGGDPKYKAEFKVDKTSSSVYVIFEAYEAVPADNSSVPKEKLQKLPDCDILDEQNWTCGGNSKIIDNVMIAGARWQMIKGNVTTQPAFLRNINSGNKSNFSYRVFKKK